MLSYRSNPHCGGQGVYLKNITRALKDMGHRVEIVSGPPDPQIEPDIPVHRLPSLDLYDPKNPFRIPTLNELKDPINLMEWAGVSTMGFPEPFTFGLRAYSFIKKRRHRFDIVHDNQSLSYGVYGISRFLPTVATIHHPITIDRAVALRAAHSGLSRLKQLRWYSFVGMQKRVARRLTRLITVSECARHDICRDFHTSPTRFHVIANGIDTRHFYPMPGIAAEPGRLMVTNSADMPLKGLYYLLHAIADVAPRRNIKLTVIGAPKKNGAVLRLIDQLNIGQYIEFTGRIDHQNLVRHYARSAIAIVPSVYEGFGLPAGEAMACGVPVISTTGGALPEVVGDCGVLVPPADSQALARAIVDLLDCPQRAGQLGQAGLKRVRANFTWQNAARQLTAAYRETIDDHH